MWRKLGINVWGLGGMQTRNKLVCHTIKSTTSEHVNGSVSNLLDHKQLFVFFTIYNPSPRGEWRGRVVYHVLIGRQLRDWEGHKSQGQSYYPPEWEGVLYWRNNNITRIWLVGLRSNLIGSIGPPLRFSWPPTTHYMYTQPASNGLKGVVYFEQAVVLLILPNEHHKQ